MRGGWLAVSMAVLTASGFAADGQDTERGKQEEQRSCVPCHSLRLIESQRLSAGAWGKELDKMERWGAVIPDRQLLLEYLSHQYPDSKAVPQPERSGDGTKATPQTH
jgi:mono/diheme cytochrome c family protein